MRGAIAAALFALLLSGLEAGCRQASAPPEEAPPAEEESSPEALRMSGINLYLHDSRPTEGVPRKPRFWVHALEFSLLDDDVWAFEDARAVIFAADTDKEEIILEAKRGRFEENRGAYLKDGVKAYVGAMTIDLMDITWERPTEAGRGEARSEHPVTVTDPDLQLKAATLRLYPDEKQFELTDVSGHVRFGREAT